MGRGRRAAALLAIGACLAVTVSGWSIMTAPPAAAAVPLGAGWGSNSSGQIGTGEEPWAKSPVLVAEGERSPDDPLIQVSAGSYSSCGVTQTGKAYCWGDGTLGALGNGTNAVATTPVLVAQGARQGDDTFVSVSVGGNFACGLSGRSEVYCWGWNNYGQLGSGNDLTSTVPVRVAGPVEFRSVTAGQENGCGIAADDSVYCWGANRYGQLGTGSSGSPVSTPTRISGGEMPPDFAAVAVSIGFTHACAVGSTGTAYCWGSNSHGQLGNGLWSFSASAPVAVTGSLSFRGIATGDSATCGVTIDDSAYCWGSGRSGQLGIGSPGPFSQTSPAQVVTAGVLAGQRIDGVALYGSTTCAVTTSGRAVCWGSNSDGQVGDGTRTTAFVPTSVISGEKWPEATPWLQISAGNDWTCAVAGGEAYCWGYRAKGALGNGTTLFLTNPAEMARGAMEPNETLSQISAGEATACGVGTSRRIYCWGTGDGGQLGNGTTGSAYAPVAILPGESPSDNTFAEVSIRTGTACARSIGGGLFCWGSNHNGQLGNGFQTASTTPVKVLDGGKPIDDTWASVATGAAFTCALASDDSAYCWGSNQFGQVGNAGVSNDYLTPQPITPAGPWKQVSAGNIHACALSGDDSAYCWGYNGNGELGDGTRTLRKQPTLVDRANLQSGESFTSLAPGEIHSCGLTSLGRILCWGGNDSGQLGNGSTVPSTIPIATAPAGIGAGVTYAAVTTSRNFSCGLATTGTAYCWGTNDYGQLGDGTFTQRLVPTEVTGPGPVRFSAISAGSTSVMGIQVAPDVPSAPTLTSATTTTSTARISFTAGANGGSVVTNYEYSLDGGPWVALSPPDKSSPVTINGLTAGTTYSVSLRAVNGAGPGGPSAPLSVTTQGTAPSPTPAPPAPTPPAPMPITPPGAPTDVVATPGDRTATVTWSPPMGPGSATALTYQVESTDPGVTCTSTITTCTVTGLVNGREYSFRVRAASDGTAGAWSEWSAKVRPVGVPSAPTRVLAVPGDDTALVSWQAPTDDGGSPILGYTVRATPGQASCTVLALSCAMTGLTNGTTYTFTVVATNGVGPSLASAPSNAVTPERRVQPSIVITGSRADRTPRERVAIMGVTTGLIGTEAQAWVKPQGRATFAARGEPIVIGETERFRWTGNIRRAAQVYFTAGDVRSNKITLPRR